VRGEYGTFVFQRQKRILKLSLAELLQQAEVSVKWTFSLTSLLRLKPPWVLFSSQRSLSVCLCTMCHNLQLILRALVNLVAAIRRRGGAPHASLVQFDLSPSTSELMNTIMHPPEDGETMRMRSCYLEECDPSSCGRGKFDQLFAPLLQANGNLPVEIFQHVQVEYVTPTGKKAKREEMQKHELIVTEVVGLLRNQIFGPKAYLRHLYMKVKLRMLIETKLTMQSGLVREGETAIAPKPSR